MLARLGTRWAVGLVVLAVMASLVVWWLAFRCHQPYCPCSTEAKAVAAAGELVSREAPSSFQLTKTRAFAEGSEWLVGIPRRVLPGHTEIQIPMSGYVLDQQTDLQITLGSAQVSAHERVVILQLGFGGRHQEAEQQEPQTAAACFVDDGAFNTHQRPDGPALKSLWAMAGPMSPPATTGITASVCV
jgi:hypothetical protein